jgi:D-3-phosphoglycerate dehydrogenase
MTKPRVLISDSMSSQAVGVFEDRGVDVVASSKLSETELLDMIGDFEGLAIRSSTNVTNELLERATVSIMSTYRPAPGAAWW